MKNLARARAELVRLELRAQQLVEELLDLRTAVSAQRSKISQLLRQRPPSTFIHSIPTELLLLILSLDVGAHPEHERQQELARVSHRWRDVILNSPIFWTTINIPRLDASAINAYLKRSAKSLIDIVITINGQDDLDYDRLTPYLAIVMPFADRWRSLDVVDVEPEVGEIITPIGEFIVEAIGHLRFPSLRRVTIPYVGDIPYPDFLSPTYAPALQHLELEGFLPYENFALPPTLETLRLAAHEFDDDESGHYSSFAYLIPTQRLTTLSLSCKIDGWILQPNSMHFPVLKTLTLSVTETDRFLQAIIAPNLERFNYNPDNYVATKPLSVIFGGLGPKFTNVQHISFPNFGSIGRLPDNEGGALSLCKAFPNVRHAELNLLNLNNLFSGRSAAEFGYHIDCWKDLQSLTICIRSRFLWVKVEGLDYLSQWIIQRQKSGLPPFHVKLTGFAPGKYPNDSLERLHDCLGYYCNLEADVPITKKAVHLSMVADNSLRMVRLCSVFPSRNKIYFPSLISAISRVNSGVYK